MGVNSGWKAMRYSGEESAQTTSDSLPNMELGTNAVGQVMGKVACANSFSVRLMLL